MRETDFSPAGILRSAAPRRPCCRARHHNTALLLADGTVMAKTISALFIGRSSSVCGHPASMPVGGESRPVRALKLHITTLDAQDRGGMRRTADHPRGFVLTAISIRAPHAAGHRCVLPVAYVFARQDAVPCSRRAFWNPMAALGAAGMIPAEKGAPHARVRCVRQRGRKTVLLSDG